MRKHVASTYYEEHGERLPYVIELTYEYGTDPEVIRFDSRDDWNAAIDVRGIRWEDMFEWTVLCMNRQDEIERARGHHPSTFQAVPNA